MTQYRTWAFALAFAAVTCSGIKPVDDYSSKTRIRKELIGADAVAKDAGVTELARAADAGTTADDLDPTAPLFAGKRMTLYASLAFLSVALLTGSIVAFLFWRQGPGFVACILMHLIAGSTMTSTVVFIYSLGFKYQASVTGAHFVFIGCVCFAVMLICPNRLGTKLVVPTRHEFLAMILPIAIFCCLNYGLNNTALAHSTVSFNELIGTATPLVSIVVLLVIGLPFDLRLLGPVCIVVLGCALTAAGDLKWSLLGFGFASLANIARASKVVTQQVVLTGQTRDKFDPCSLLAWVCVPSFVLILAWTILVDGMAPLVALRDSEHQGWLVLAIMVSCVNALVLDLTALFVVKQLGAVGAEVVGSAKSGLTVLSGIALFHDKFSLIDCFGFAFVLLGLFVYTRMEAQVKERAAMMSLDQDLAKGVGTGKTGSIGSTNPFEESTAAESSAERKFVSVH